MLDNDPIESARMLCNIHVCKMLIESVQLLSSQFDVKDRAPYKRTHYNHPCSIWVRTCQENYDWLIEHALQILKEYTNAYKKNHACEQPLLWCIENKYLLNLPITLDSTTPFPLCMPEQYKVPGDPATSYRNYYKGDKARFAKWTHGRQQPYWW